MCGRYTLIRLADFTDMFPWIRGPEEQPEARYNIAPTQAVAAVANRAEPAVEFLHWGLIPYWAKDPSIGSRMINARAETLAEKPVFRTALKRRRCVIPASGFYEWRKNADGTKTPMYLRRRDGRPLALAGLWERWSPPDGSEVRSCTIITGRPNELVREIHDRMPVILPDDAVRRWLQPGEVDAEDLQPLLVPYPADEIEAYPVSRMVNNPKADSSKCIEPVEVVGHESGSESPKSSKPSKPSRRGKSTQRKGPGLFDAGTGEAE